MFKRYLWCIALVLCMAGSAYAVKGGKIGSHIKKDTVSWLANSKPGRWLAVALLGITIACSPITGCGGENPVASTETEMVANGSDLVDTTLIADHPDLGIEVVLQDDQGRVDRVLLGEIIGVDINGMRKIEIHTVLFMDNERKVLDVPLIRSVDEETEYGEGGYLTLDEFAKRFD